jgi:hypothetical protein
MRFWGCAAIALLLTASPALAWNEKGHLAIARLAWLKLSSCERAACAEILKSHPHYGEYLTADKPTAISVDEWAFMRAAYWPDWIRSNYSDEYNRPTWHYVTVAYVPPYSKLKASDLPGREPNVVTQIPACLEKIRSASDVEKAIHLCWLLHLVGDIHQPLHCASQLSEAFPQGDQGGNLAIVRLLGGMPVRLHFAWDAMLGEELELAAILKTVDELQAVRSEHTEACLADVDCRATAADWAREGFELARIHVYLNGDLRPCHVDEQARGAPIPDLSETYVQNAVTVARRRAVQAAQRLADCLSKSLR